MESVSLILAQRARAYLDFLPGLLRFFGKLVDHGERCQSGAASFGLRRSQPYCCESGFNLAWLVLPLQSFKR